MRVRSGVRSHASAASPTRERAICVSRLATILADEVPPYYMAQLQCGLLVSGRKWIDFVSFVGGMPLYVKRVYPDTAWFAAIEEAVTTFETNAARMVADYETATTGLALTERMLELEMSL